MNEEIKTKKIYFSPEIETDDMLLFGQGGGGGSSCDGTTSGGKKGTTAAPDNCNANKLKT